jgi:hypothetical protein
MLAIRSLSMSLGCTLILLAGCTVTRNVTLTQRSSIEQRLLIRSLERALAQLDLEAFTQSNVVLDIYGLTADRGFAQEFIKARFRERGLRLVTDDKSAELHLKVFLNALGVDRAENLMGLPQGVAPLISVPTPEIALFKSVFNRGYAEIEIYAFDETANRFIKKTARSAGNAKYDDFTFRVFISFNLDDLDEDPAEAGEGGF